MKEFLIVLFNTIPRLRLKRSAARKVSCIQEVLKVLEEEKKGAEVRGATSVVELHNTGIYLILLNLDITILNKQLMLESDSLTQKVYSKQLISIYHEFFEDFPKIFGEKIKSISESLPQKESHMAQFKEICLELKSFKKQHSKEFKRVRNYAGSHRDLNGDLQLGELNGIDVSDIKKLSYYYEIWSSKIFGFLTEILADYKSSWTMVEELSKKIEQAAGGDVAR